MRRHSIENEELNALLKTIYNQGQEIEELKAKIKKAKKWCFATKNTENSKKSPLLRGDFYVIWGGFDAFCV